MEAVVTTRHFAKSTACPRGFLRERKNMSDYAYTCSSLLAGSAEFDRMKQEIRTIISLTTSRLEKGELPRNEDKEIWGELGDRCWRISIAEHKWVEVNFIYGTKVCMQFSPQNNEMRLPFGPMYLKIAHEYLQEYLDGMLAEFGAPLGERLKMFSILGEKS